HRRAILQRPDPPRIHAIIGEPVLRWLVGGREVMREQLLELWDLPHKHPNITIQVVPFSAGEHYGLDGTLTIFFFEEGGAIGHVESILGGGTYLESAADLEEIRLRREGIEAAALSPQKSADMIRDAADAI